MQYTHNTHKDQILEAHNNIDDNSEASPTQFIIKVNRLYYLWDFKYLKV